MNKRGGVLELAIVLVIILIVVSLLWFFIIRKDKDAVLKSPIPTPQQDTTLPPQNAKIPNPEAFEQLDKNQQDALLDLYAVDENTRPEDCEKMTLKDICYLKLSQLKNDKTLCNKITIERYREACQG